MTTIKDIAQQAGVSVATVSRVINNLDSVTGATKKKVMAVIAQSNYMPNFGGKLLRQSKSWNVLVSIPNVSDSFYSQILVGIEKALLAQGYQMIVAVSNYSADSERKQMEMLTTRFVDGVILTLPRMPNDEITEYGKQYPIVLCASYLKNCILPKVGIDYYRAAFEATEMLIRHGHKRVALISRATNYSVQNEDKKNGFIDALKRHNIDFDPSYYISVEEYADNNSLVSAAENGCRRLLQLPDPPTAFFSATDYLAVGAVKELLREGLSVGDKYEVVGFDNTELSELFVPSITTIAQPRFEMGKSAANLLIEKINDPEAINKSVILPHTIVLRNSTRPEK